MATKRKRARGRATTARTVVKHRKHSKRRYRRNPPTGTHRAAPRRQSTMSSLTDLATGGAAGLAGMAVGHFALTKIAPSVVGATDSISTAAFKRFGVSAGLAALTAIMGPKVVSRRIAEAAALGMLLPAMRDAVVAMSPEAATYLGRSDFERTFPGRGAFAGYSNAGDRAALAGYSDAAGARGLVPLADYGPGGYSRTPWAP